MKKLIVLVVLIIVGSAGWYIWTGRDGVRTYYQGHAQIESVTMDVVIERLEKTGCTEQSKTCHYVFDKEKNVLYVNLYAKGRKPFGPGGTFKISDNKVYGSFDIEGRRSTKRFETALKDLIKNTGNVVTPIDGTWTVTKTSDATGLVY